MPILEIDGVGKVEVGAEFLQLSDEDRALTVEEIISSRGAEPETSPIDDHDEIVARGGLLPIGMTRSGERVGNRARR